jgi:MoaA/NifB/PqqE/SkfB family radical SAM enzyme
MKLPHNNFCVLPWVSLEASPIGTVRPCCLSDDEIVDNTGEKFLLASAKFEDIQNSQHMQQLRQDFLDGKKPQTCRKCWNEEESGRTSKRMHTLDRLKHLLPTQTWTADAKPLMFLDLKLGNICNLKCRICGSWSSSTFAVEEIAHDFSINRKKSFHYQMLKAGAWPRDNAQFWNQIEESLNDIRYIEFTGGEPFMIAEHFDMLQGIVDRGIAHQVEIHYNTNGTQYPGRAEEIWKHFKTVEIAFSIDDVKERFEYQRTNAVWADVVANIALFKKMRDRLQNIQLQVCSTVNVFNVSYLDDLANWIDQQDFDFIYWNMMHDAWYLSISRLSDSAKTIIKNRVEQFVVDSKHKIEFERMIDFMMQGESSDGTELLKQIAKLDLRRNQNLCDHHIVLANAIGYNADK